MLAPLDNGTIFKKAFTDKTVFISFVKDILGIDIDVDKIETEKKFDPKVGYIDITMDIFSESVDHLDTAKRRRDEVRSGQAQTVDGDEALARVRRLVKE